MIRDIKNNKTFKNNYLYFQLLFKQLYVQMNRYFINLELKVYQDDLMYYYAVCEIKIEKKMFFPDSPIQKL